tara:strand:+ start:44 stop:826 length:783 start_codon:yes stop_codon:yes gene_type:complete
MISKYNLATISPDFGSAFDADTGGTDILFDWTPMEIPNGACILKTLSGTIMGHDGAAANGVDFRLYFAKSIDGTAPSSFGTAHAARGANQAPAFRRNILGAVTVDMSTIDDADNLTAYMVLQSKLAIESGTSGEFRGTGILLQGEPNVTRKGFQTIYIAGEAAGAAFTFGTAVALNMAASANVDADTTGTSVVLTTSGTDPRLVFQPGDIIIGSTGTVEMEVVSVDSATQMTVKNITAQIDHAEKLLHKNPMTLNFGLEY